ncbi:MAG: hypothetical protein ACLFSQ_02430 [Candidatus Zixiibacteriota bacterium]
MKKVILVGLIFGLLLFSIACSEDEDDKFVNDPPENLQFYIDADTIAVLEWDASPDADSDDFLYYEVFLATSSIKDGAIPTDTFTTVYREKEVPLVHNQKRYFAVRTRLNNSEDSLSDFSNEVDIAATKMGTDTLYQIEISDTMITAMGFDDDGGHIYEMAAENQSKIHLYFTTDGDGTLIFESPHLYSSAFHECQFEELGSGSWKHYNTISGNVDEDFVTLETGKSIVVKTVTNNFAKIRILQLAPYELDDDYYKAVVQYSYQPYPEYRCF